MKPNKTNEIRFSAVGYETRDGGKSRVCTGYALLFDSMSEDLGGFREIIEPGAITDEILANSDVLALIDHDKSLGVLARSKNGVGGLKLEIDDKGLRFEFEIPDTNAGRDLIEYLERGIVSQCSFGFTVDEDEWTELDDGTGTYLRTIKRFSQIFDVSMVYTPAYPETSCAMRALENFRQSLSSEKSSNSVRMKTNKRNNDELVELMKRYLKRELDEDEQKDEDETASETEDEKQDEERESDDVKKESDDERECDEDEKDEETASDDETEDKEEEASDDEPEDDKEDEEASDDDEEEVEEKKKRHKRSKSVDRKHTMNKNQKPSLIKALRALTNGQAYGPAEQRMHEAGMAEFRKSNITVSGRSLTIPFAATEPETRGAILAGTAGAGAEVVSEQKLSLETALRERLVLAQAGCTFLSGLVGNVSIPFYSGTTANWKQEGAAADRGEGTFSEKVLSPKRLTSIIHVSRQFLLQDGIGAEESLKRDIIDSISVAFEKTILGSADGSQYQPQGLFFGVTPDSTPVSFADTVAWETELEHHNVYAPATYILSPSAKGILRTTPVDSGSGIMVMNNNEINGIPAYSTQSVTDKGLILGDMSQIVIGTWSGVSLTVDETSLCDQDTIRIVVNFYVDAIVKNDDALVRKILA